MSFELSVNGYQYKVKLADYAPDTTLNLFLRLHLNLMATKYMCLEGGCGACIVVIRRKNPANGQVITRAANSCLTLLYTCANAEILTNEGLGNKRDGYHPIQKRLAQLNGSQCGFCSSGFVMNMYGLLESKQGKVTMNEVENAFGGNICRCTGYRPILDAMKSFAVDSTAGACTEIQDIEDSYEILCPRTGQCCSSACSRIDSSVRDANDVQWYWPTDLVALFNVLNQVGRNTEYMLVAGNTAHGVYRRSLNIKHFIYLNLITELQQHSIEPERVVLGGNITLTDAMVVFLQAAQRPGFEYCQQLWQHFDLIATVPVRNNGTLAGNISIKKEHPEFKSDVFLTFETLDVQVIVQSEAQTQRQMSLAAYLSDRTPKLLLRALVLKPYPQSQYIFQSYKILARAQATPAYVNAGFFLALDPTSSIVQAARVCFGGLRPDFVHATSIENYLKGRNLYDAVTVSEVFKQLSQLLHPSDTLPETSPEYRLKLACGLFYKFLLSTAPEGHVRESFRSGGALLHRALSSGSQSFQTISKNFPITQPVRKLEALIQCSGEATYIDDMVTTTNTVYCAFVRATKVGANIELIDASAALALQGVVAFYAAKDIPGTNTFNGSLLSPETEEIFCADKVKHYDQPLGMIAAATHDIALHAATLVRVTYSNIGEQIYPTMESVLKAGNLRQRMVQIYKTAEFDVERAKDTYQAAGRGNLALGSQYHFTMEPQTTVVVPHETGLKVYASTQWMDLTQAMIAGMLGLPNNCVYVDVPRVGGGYGAKVTRNNQVSCAAALAAYKLNRPARFVQTIESMMSCNGKRWACYSEYDFQALASGRINLLRNTFYEDGGCTLNENVVNFLTRPALRNCYDLNDANFKINATAVRTDAPSSTWCRSPGSAEAIAMTESMLEHVAFECRLDPADARLVNLRAGNKMLQLLPKFLQSTEYRQRRHEIDLYNTQQRWRKRGLGLALMEFPLTTGVFLNYPSTVAIYHTDGSVLITHGGIEIGQGLNTKVAQVAAFVLGVPLESVKLASSNSLNGANAMITANSVASEMVCLGVRKACTTLNVRLAPIRSTLPPNATWQQLVQTAWERGVVLLATDSYKKGEIPNYNIYGLTLTELELDVLTGNHLIKRVDILEDAGESLSPLIDVGQVEGAFVMGLGYYLTERLVYDRQTGKLLTNRTWNYYPPGAKDIPIDFRIELLQNTPNPVGFMRSKATGEPAFCMAVSALFAIQHALQSARQDAGLPREWVNLGAPTTPETVVLNAGNDECAFSLQ